MTNWLLTTSSACAAPRASPRWRWPDKLLGTLVWPFGYLGALYGLVAGRVHQRG